MMTRILAHQRDLGNGVGPHYSGFRRFSAFPASPNQLLAPTQPRENRRHHPPIREVGLGYATDSSGRIRAARALTPLHGFPGSARPTVPGGPCFLRNLAAAPP